MEKAIEIRGLVKDFGEIRAINRATFDVSKGEIFGLIGPNGAGKTTTLRIVSTLLQITEGSVSVFSLDVREDAARVREFISYLPEEAGAYKNLSGKAYLEFMVGFFSSGDKERQQMVGKGVEIAKLEERINDKVTTYSKGMTRKLLVARALMINPRLAILDEPTSGLDVINAQDIRGLIKDFVRKGTTVLLSSHNMLEVDFLCDRIALIDKGKIVESGTPPQLKKKYSASNIEEVFMEAVR
jgi:ABC-2 type transport system ATP-binding protein